MIQFFRIKFTANRLKLKDTITDLYLKFTNNIFGFIDWDDTQKNMCLVYKKYV